MPTRKPQKRKLGELGSKSTKRVSLGDHSEQVYLPAQMKWVDIAEWVQSDDHFCLNIAPFFVDTFDGFRTNCIGVSSMDYFPAMKVCNLGESQVLDPKAPTTLVYLVSLVFGRLCVRSAPEITQAPKFAYLANFEVIKAINAEKLDMSSLSSTKEFLVNKNVYDNKDLPVALFMYSREWAGYINEWLKSDKKNDMIFHDRITFFLGMLSRLATLDLSFFRFSPLEQDLKKVKSRPTIDPNDELVKKLASIDRHTMLTYLRKQIENIMAILDDGFVKECQVTSSPRILYKGVNVSASEAELSDNCYSRLFDEHGIYRIGGYISTSTEIGVARTFKVRSRCCLLAIHTQDVPTLDLANTANYTHEKEVLLSRFTKLKYLHTVVSKRDATIMHHVQATYCGPRPTPTPCDVFSLASIVQYNAHDESNELNNQRLELKSPSGVTYTHAWFAQQELSSKLKRHIVKNGLVLASKLNASRANKRHDDLFGSDSEDENGGSKVYQGGGGASGAQQGGGGSKVYQGGGGGASGAQQGGGGSKKQQPQHEGRTLGFYDSLSTYKHANKSCKPGSVLQALDVHDVASDDNEWEYMPSSPRYAHHTSSPSKAQARGEPREANQGSATQSYTSATPSSSHGHGGSQTPYYSSSPKYMTSTSPPASSPLGHGGSQTPYYSSSPKYMTSTSPPASSQLGHGGSETSYSPKSPKYMGSASPPVPSSPSATQYYSSPPKYMPSMPSPPIPSSPLGHGGSQTPYYPSSPGNTPPSVL